VAALSQIADRTTAVDLTQLTDLAELVAGVARRPILRQNPLSARQPSRMNRASMFRAFFVIPAAMKHSTRPCSAAPEAFCLANIPAWRQSRMRWPRWALQPMKAGPGGCSMKFERMRLLSRGRSVILSCWNSTPRRRLMARCA